MRHVHRYEDWVSYMSLIVTSPRFVVSLNRTGLFRGHAPWLYNVSGGIWRDGCSCLWVRRPKLEMFLQHFQPSPQPCDLCLFSPLLRIEPSLFALTFDFDGLSHVHSYFIHMSTHMSLQGSLRTSVQSFMHRFTQAAPFGCCSASCCSCTILLCRSA